jgi:hypothetical protein
MNKILRVTLVIGILAAFVFCAIPVSATADPSPAPSIPNGTLKIYHNLLEPLDYFIIWEANIPYTVAPTTPITETFVWQFIHTDGITTLGSTSGYVYQNGGYGYNVYSMYWPAATAPTWGTIYSLRLTGSPALFVTPPVYNFTLNASDYTTLTSQADNQASLAAKILTIAGDLTTRWGLATDYNLVAQTDTGDALSRYGEEVMRGAIYGVQSLAPTAFSSVVTNITVTSRNWTTNYQTNLENQWAGSWVDTARNASITFFGTGYDLLGIFWLILACVGLLIGNLMLTNDYWNGLIDIVFLMVIAARMGVYSLGVLGLIAAIAIIYIGMNIWKRIPGV